MKNDRRKNAPGAGAETAPLCLLVLGMHRSGTSAITRSLECLGVELGDSLLPETPENPAGYFEDRDVYFFHEQSLLPALGITWCSLHRPAWEALPAWDKEALLEEAAHLLKRKFSGTRLFALKDPRMCLTFPFWRDVLARLGWGVRIVCPLRDPLSVTRSLQRRDGFTAVQATYLWGRHTASAYRYSKGFLRAFIPFDDLFTDAGAALRALARDLDLPEPPDFAARLDRFAEEFLRREMRHSACSLPQVLAAPELPQRVKELYQHLLALATGRTEAAPAKLDRLVNLWLAEERFTEDLLADYDTLAAQVTGLKRQAQAGETQLHRAVDVAQEQHRLLAEGQAMLQTRLTAALEQAAAASQHAMEMQGRYAELSAVAHQRQDQIYELHAAVGARDRRLEQATEQQMRLEGEAAARRIELATGAELLRLAREESTARLAEVRQYSEQWRGAEALVRERDVALAARERELSQLSRQAKEQEEGHARLAREAGERERELASELLRSQGFQAEVIAREAELAHLRTQVREAERRAAAATRQADLQAAAAHAQAAADLQRVAALPPEQKKPSLGRRWWRHAQLALRLRKSGLFDAEWYRHAYADVAESGWSPLRHFVFAGLREGREPCGLFDSAWYLSVNPDVRAARLTATEHYLHAGAAEGRDPHPLFDTHYYLSLHPDVRESGIGALGHYQRWGWREGRSPNPLFDLPWYLAQNEDVRALGLEPLSHFIACGLRQGRLPCAGFSGEALAEAEAHGRIAHHAARYLRPYFPLPRLYGEGGGEASPLQLDRRFHPPRPADFEPLQSGPHEARDGIRALAFYLPQYHRIPENDLWWGEGFTEWTNVRRGTPFYRDHYQPHRPHEHLDYYDLNDETVLERQAELARAAGLHGFCFYYYWFNGKRLLEMPLDRLIATGRPEIPFCYCWANENWSRRWDGSEHALLIAQEHSWESDERFIVDILEVFRDRRYLRIGGRPLLLIYRPLLLPNPAETFAHWRAVCRTRGVGEIYLAGVQGFGFSDPSEIGLDAAVEFPPNCYPAKNISWQMRGVAPEFQGSVYNYTELVEGCEAKADPGYTLFRGVMPSWDNTARRRERGASWVGASPHNYRLWLEAVAARTAASRPPEERLVFINAWNEWAEGAHLEPDARFGYAWLNATRAALCGPAERPKVLVIGHDASRAGAQILLLGLLREWRRTGEIEAHLWLGEGGELRADFEEICPTRCLTAEFLRAGPAAWALALGGRPDVIYSNTVVNGPVLAELSRWRVPILTHVHELQKSIERWAPGRIMEETLRHSQAFIAVSEAVEENLRTTHALPPGRLRRVYEYLEPTPASLSPDERRRRRAELNLPAEALLVFGCGTTDWRKGPDLFIDIAARCLRRTSRLHFIWIGIGAELESLRERLTAEGLAEHVQFIGPQADPRAWFAAGDIFLLSSREDPFPVVALEGADAALPIVCFAGAGGMPELVDRGCGATVPYEDAAAAAEVILHWVEHPDERIALGLQARAEVLRHHHIAGAAQAIAGVLGELSPRAFPSRPALPSARPLLSIIVPGYNHARYLPERLRSILAQGVGSCEILLLDDASTDESPRLMAEFAATHDHARFLPNTRNSGSTFRQWVKGLTEARGEYVWIAESDDSALPGLAARLLEVLQADPRLALACCQSRMIGPEGQDLGLPRSWTGQLDPERWEQDFRNDGRDEIERWLTSLNTIPNASAVIFRNRPGLETLVETGMRLCADWLFWIRLLAQGDIAFVAEPLNLWRLSTSNARTRLPGETEAQEGPRVLAEAGLILGNEAAPEYISCFQTRCEAWQKGAIS